jgi:hypothetical protein
MHPVLQPVRSTVVGITVTIQLYSLAARPVEYLLRQEALRARLHVDELVLKPYHDVFVTAVRAYQQYSYLELVGWICGQQVARQVAVHQRRLIDFTAGTGNSTGHALRLVEGALETGSVSAVTRAGEVEIPIEMNVALALLLGLPESPDYAATAALRFEQIARMQPEIDWRLAYCLARGREEIKQVFLPIFTRFFASIGDGAPAGVWE